MNYNQEITMTFRAVGPITLEDMKKASEILSKLDQMPEFKFMNEKFKEFISVFNADKNG